MNARPPRSSLRWIVVVAALLGMAGAAWLAWAVTSGPNTTPPVPATVADAVLTPGTVAAMDSAAFTYSPGWAVSKAGADPAEPPAPEQEPSGMVEFAYTGRDLALLIAPGDYWGYLFVTVDGAPANLLPALRGNADSTGALAGYKPLYDPAMPLPGRAQADSPVQDSSAPFPEGAGVWLRVHRATNDAPKRVRVEAWRSWGQTPLRAVAVDALPPVGPPTWPGVALLPAACGLLLAAGVKWKTKIGDWRLAIGTRVQSVISNLQSPISSLLAAGGVLLVALSVSLGNWLLCWLGLGLLGVAGLLRPALWLAALLGGLPFYYTYALTLLPGRAFNLVDVGVIFGLLIAAAHLLVMGRAPERPGAGMGRAGLLLGLIAAWALVATADAERFGVALREWRTVFLMGLLFVLALWAALAASRRPHADTMVMVGGWVAGATAAALLGLALYVAGSNVVQAEGVGRLRGFYGSPNNLALYLGRTMPVSLGLALLGAGRARLLWAGAAAVQLAAFLLTYSKGGLFLALPALLAALWLGGYVALGRAGRPRRVLWGLAMAAGVAVLALLPVLATPRFQNLLDFSTGTGFLRLNLWRSAWQMALDHPLLGVGPDNFLYAYRSSYILPAAWQEPNLNHPHNWPLDWWTRLGLPGLALGLALWGTTVAGLWRGVTRAPGEAAALYAGLLAAVAGALAHGLIDASYALPDLMVVWALLAGLAARAARAYSSNS